MIKNNILMIDPHHLAMAKTISGIGFMLCFVLKIGLHIHLDYTNGFVAYGWMYLYTPSVFFRRYKSNSGEKKIGAEWICNAFLYGFYLLLLTNILFGVMILFSRSDQISSVPV